MTTNENKCPHCGQIIKPTLSLTDYEARALPRLELIEQLAKKIDFASYAWALTPTGERYRRLMDEQAKDEHAAGL